VLPLALDLHVIPPKNTFVRCVQVSIRNQVGRLALLTVLLYAVIQVIPHRIFNHAISFIASAVWGS
jgi:hypothetical protein